MKTVRFLPAYFASAAPVALVALSAAACQSAPAPQEAASSYAVRPGLDAPLAVGFEPAGREPVTVTADAPFLLRMSARAEGAPQRFSLEYRRNGAAWTPVEAHDFPLPERELVLDFTTAESGAPLTHVVLQGSARLSAEADGGETALSLEAGDAPGLALIDAPWPLEAFSLAADLTLPPDGGGPIALVFGYQSEDDHARLVIDAQAGVMALERVQAGRTRTLAHAEAPVVSGARISVEVQSEEGVLSAELDDGSLRLSAPRPGDLPAEALGFQLMSGSARVHAVELAGEASTPPISIVSAPGFAHGARAAPVLSGDARGLAVSLQPETPIWSARQGAVGEFVWPLVIRRFADDAVFNESGDQFELRLVDDAGRRAHLGANPVLRLSVPDGHLGGTFVETPGRIGPFQSDNGTLYVIMEPAETDNLFMMVKSSDGGRTWREVDGAGRPATGDLEAVDARRIDGAIHIIHQITEAVVHHVFNTDDHASRPDQWAVTDQPVAHIEAVSQMATLAAPGEAGLATVFLGDSLYVSRKTRAGAWTDPVILDEDADALTVGPQAIAGADGVVHVAYADADGALWLRTLTAHGALSPRRMIAEGAVTGEADYGAILPLVYLAETDTLIIAYRLADASLWERRLTGGRLTAPRRITDRAVITNAVDSQQAGADIVNDGDTLHALFIEADSRSIYSAHDCGAGWSEPVRRVADIEGSWVRGAVHSGGEGGSVYRYVYDAGSNGGSGLNRYGEIALSLCE